MKYARVKVGLWLVGAGGRVGSAVALGVTALSKRLTPSTGLVSALPAFESLRLVDPGSLYGAGPTIRNLADPCGLERERSAVREGQHLHSRLVGLDGARSTRYIHAQWEVAWRRALNGCLRT